MLLLRDAQKSDLPAILALARHLDSVNLPHDRRALAAIVARSVKSFRGELPALQRSYLFVLEDPGRRRVVGTSMLIAQHGTRESPCTFFDVSEREHYSSRLDTHFRHRVLSLGYHFDGPTEIGGLVVHPRHRGGPEQPGKTLALGRFLYLAAHRTDFRDTVLAELMPPLTPEGHSLFWESFGRRFTGIDYPTADRLSREDKAFIQQLFPPGGVYATLLPLRIQRLVGAVGPETRRVQRLLARIGFRYVGRIDPFDGGPHYECKTDEILPVKERQQLLVAEGTPARDAAPLLVGVEPAKGPVRFRAVRTPAEVYGLEVRLPAGARRLLRVGVGDGVSAIGVG